MGKCAHVHVSSKSNTICTKIQEQNLGREGKKKKKGGGGGGVGDGKYKVSVALNILLSRLCLCLVHLIATFKINEALKRVY